MKTLQPSKSKPAGFSLVELLVVLAIMAIMVGMLTSRSSNSYQQKRMAACEKNLQTIYTALNLYALDNNNAFPMVANATSSEQPLSLLVPKCTTVTEIFICPGSKDQPIPAGEPFADRKISYAYYMGVSKADTSTQPLITDRQVNTMPKKPGMQVFSADGKGIGSNHDRFGGNILSTDGSIAATKAKSAADLSISTGVTLLNPKP